MKPAFQAAIVRLTRTESPVAVSRRAFLLEEGCFSHSMPSSTKTPAALWMGLLQEQTREGGAGCLPVVNAATKRGWCPRHWFRGFQTTFLTVESSIMHEYKIVPSEDERDSSLRHGHNVCICVSQIKRVPPPCQVLYIL